jgi:DNA-directed RNA polymerase-5 subunit 1
MDDICLSPELDGTLGMPTFEHSYERQNFWDGRFRENSTTVNASWEQNASASGSIKIPPRGIFF